MIGGIIDYHTGDHGDKIVNCYDKFGHEIKGIDCIEDEDDRLNDLFTMCYIGVIFMMLGILMMSEGPTIMAATTLVPYE